MTDDRANAVAGLVWPLRTRVSPFSASSGPPEGELAATYDAPLRGRYGEKRRGLLQ